MRLGKPRSADKRRVIEPRHDPFMDMVRFGRGIRALRMRRGWRQIDLAEAAAVSQSIVSRIERGLGARLALETLSRYRRHSGLASMFD